MKKTFRIFIIISLTIIKYNSVAWAQSKQGQEKIDSLITILKTAKKDTLKVNILNELSITSINISPEEALKYSSQSKELAKKLNYHKGLALATKWMGNAYYTQGKYVDAMDNWLQARVLFDSIGDKKGVANMYSNIGAIYNIEGYDAKALEVYLKSLNIAEEINDTLRILSALINTGSVYANNTATYDKALENYHRALPLSIALNDRDAIGTVTVNIGEIYFNKNDKVDTSASDKTRDIDSALFYFDKSAKAYDSNSINLIYTLNYIGKVYEKKKDYDAAMNYHQQAYDRSKKVDAKQDMAVSLLGIARTYQQKGDVQQAIVIYKKVQELAKEIGATRELKEVYEGLASLYNQKSDFGNAFKYQVLLTGIKDTLYNSATDKKMLALQFNFDLDKKQNEISLLSKDKEIQQQEIKRQKLVRNGFLVGFIIVLLFAGVFFSQRNKIKKEKKRSDQLLLNILPAEVAEELKAKGSAEAKQFDKVTVMFTDFKDFTQISEKLSPVELVAEIDTCFKAFDNILSKYIIEKIKTIGDSYMCAGGLPVANETNALDVVSAAMEIQQYMREHLQRRKNEDKEVFEIRIGIHTGPVVAGIVGVKKFAYDIWGDTVNTASRMESSGESGKVNISGSTYELVKDKFTCTYRGKIQAKNKGEIDMYFVETIS